MSCLTRHLLQTSQTLGTALPGLTEGQPGNLTCRVCTWVAHLPTTVSTSFSMSALMYIRPRRSVWSVPHRLGTFITQRLCTFIIQAVGRRERKGRSALLSPLPKLTGCSEGMGGEEIVLLLNRDVCEGFWDKHAAKGPSNAAGDSGRALPGHGNPPPSAVLGPAYRDYRAFSPYSNYLSFVDLSNFSSITPVVQCWVFSLIHQELIRGIKNYPHMCIHIYMYKNLYI